MTIQLNHTIVHSHDKAASANFLSDVLGLPPPTPFSHFLVVETANGVSLDFTERSEGEIRPQHYAFLVGDRDFDNILKRVKARGLDYWADPAGTHLGEVNTRHGGRGFYFEDPNGHWLEVMTRPYGDQ